MGSLEFWNCTSATLSRLQAPINGCTASGWCGIGSPRDEHASLSVWGCTWASTLLPVVLGQSFLIDLWHSMSCPHVQAIGGWVVVDCCSVCRYKYLCAPTVPALHRYILVIRVWKGVILHVCIKDVCCSCRAATECQVGKASTASCQEIPLWKQDLATIYFNILDLFIFCSCIFSHNRFWLLQELWGSMKNSVFFTFVALAKDGTET